MSTVSGRTCPLRYRYHPRTLRDCPETASQTLYVIGGLYGNLPALRAIEAMAAAEAGPLTLCFNGDFNWFNSDPAGFAAINAAVLRHDACQGNVEAELYAPGDEAGCGCAYPEAVDAGVVERSNAIHARLKQTAQLYPEILQQLETLPMVRRYRVGTATVGVVHGDAESLAGWRFDITALDDPANQDWLGHAFKQAGVDITRSRFVTIKARGSEIFWPIGRPDHPLTSRTFRGFITVLSTRWRRRFREAPSSRQAATFPQVGAGNTAIAPPDAIR
ncbi:MAG: hypothetical protein IPG34_08035 [Rhodocyclaceae bacterium]|nr:hypothetical protein [Rhodocyclaceae bacterium]